VSAVGLTLSDLFPARPPVLLPDGSRKPIPKFHAHELIQLAAFEATVVSLVAGDVLAGKPQEQIDFARLRQAHETLQAIVEEVSHV